MEPKVYNVSQETSNVIYQLFEGTIDELTKQSIRDVYNNPDNYDILTEDVFKELTKIIRYRDNKDIDYRIILKPSTLEPKSNQSTEIQPTIKKDKQTKYILSQRKAFVNWINDEFYPQLIKSKRDDEVLKIYQRFVKNYLSIKTPYRGLLVYHGLGTGKSATAISTAEGLSNSIPITTLLPASLETEFIKEIKLWGNFFFKVDTNNWTFYELSNIQSNTTLRKQINDEFYLTLDKIKSISIRSRNVTKNKTLKTGFWMPVQRDHTGSTIKTVPTIKSGETYASSTSYIKHDKQDTDIECEKLTEDEITFINLQMTEIIKKKYDFIHYNPLPSLTIEKKKSYTDNEKKSIRLLKELNKNKKVFINSPFNERVIVIDEVHNFVREIYNNSGPSRQYYDWIINAENIKLVCLSGTPIINRPSEIAILCNMLKGIIKTYTFTIGQTVDIESIDSRLRDIFYAEDSPVEQFYYQKREGKFVISFTKNKTNFESMVNPETNIVYTYKHEEQNFKDFIEFIFRGFKLLFKGNVVPNKETVLKDKKNILNGISQTYDKQLNIRFNVHQKLFEVYKKDGTVIDLTYNENFIEYFFNNDETKIKLSKRILLKRMLMGLISYYPIDRSAIKNMPETTKPINNLYKDYNISKKINIVECPTSYKQFIKYEEVWKEAKLKSMKQNMFGQDEKNENFDYHIRTRQACNIVYENDDFRKIK